MSCRSLINTPIGDLVQNHIDDIVFGNRKEAKINKLDLCVESNNLILYEEIYLRWKHVVYGNTVYSVSVDCNNRVNINDSGTWEDLKCCKTVRGQDICLKLKDIVAIIVTGLFTPQQLTGIVNSFDPNQLISNINFYE